MCNCNYQMHTVVRVEWWNASMPFNHMQSCCSTTCKLPEPPCDVQVHRVFSAVCAMLAVPGAAQLMLAHGVPSTWLNSMVDAVSMTLDIVLR